VAAAPRLVVANATLRDVKRHTGRIDFGRRRRSELSAAEQIHLRSPVYGAMSPGVRRQRVVERPEPDVSARIRASIEARRGYPRSWRS
jgi:hypothetical protein